MVFIDLHWQPISVHRFVFFPSLMSGLCADQLSSSTLGLQWTVIFIIDSSAIYNLDKLIPVFVKKTKDGVKFSLVFQSPRHLNLFIYFFLSFIFCPNGYRRLRKTANNHIGEVATTSFLRERQNNKAFRLYSTPKTRKSLLLISLCACGQFHYWNSCHKVGKTVSKIWENKWLSSNR